MAKDEKDKLEDSQAGKPGPLDFDLVVERWWQDHFPGGPVARNTEAWNAAYRAKEDLKQRLRGE